MSSLGSLIGGGHGDHYQTIKIGPSQKIAAGASSVQSAAFRSTTKIIRIFSTVDVWVLIGANPTAANNDGNSMFVPGGIIQFIAVSGSEKLAVIRDGSSGSLHICEGDSQ